jgi:hypothetical protein
MDPPHETNSAPDWDFDEPEDVLSFTAKWDNPLLWDVDSPQNIYAATLTLQDEAGNELDTLPPVHFGFREFSQKGREKICCLYWKTKRGFCCWELAPSSRSLRMRR